MLNAFIIAIPLSGLRKFRLALVQLAVGADKAANITRAEGMVREAAQNGAKIVSLPVNNFRLSLCYIIVIPPCRSASTAHTVRTISPSMPNLYLEAPPTIFPSSRKSVIFILSEVND